MITCFYGKWKVEIGQGIFAQLQVFDCDIALLNSNFEVFPFQAFNPLS